MNTVLDLMLSTITAEQIVTTMVCVPLIFAYACRFRSISWFTTKLDVVAFNAAMLIVCGAAMYRSALGISDYLDWAGLAAAALWLRISWFTWGRGRAPAHVITRPVPLDSSAASINHARARTQRTRSQK